MIALGVMAGIVLAGLASRVLSSLVFEVEPIDPWTFASVVVLLLVAGLLACALPARWATGVDAVTALRAD